MRGALLLCLLAVLPACREEVAEIPAPVVMTEDALSYFCQMNVADHGGPKGQVHLEGLPDPLFFAQVRDLVAYLKSPERDARILASYVSDMAVAPNWQAPGNDNWTNAETAFFVVGAGVAGGMGAPEIVPFAAREGAEAFVGLHGGDIMGLDEIPESEAVGPVDLDIVLEQPS